MCVCVPEQSLKWNCSASGQFRVGFSFFNSELNSPLSWFCFKTLHWTSYKCKRKKGLEIKATHFHWVSSLISPCHLLCQQIKFSLVCHADAETTVCASSKPHQSKTNMWSQCVLAGITKSVCIVLGISAPLELPACEAFSASLRGSKTSRNYGCKWNNTNVTWAESYTSLPPLRDSLCSVTVFHVEL